MLTFWQDTVHPRGDIDFFYLNVNLLVASFPPIDFHGAFGKLAGY